MAAKKVLYINSAELRSRAEERLSENRETVHPPGTWDEPLRLLHELQVHQIELEMQNAELLKTREELESALTSYTDLYDFAPVGYFTLDRDGIIRGVNLTGASLLGIERSRLIGRRFGLYVATESSPIFSEFLGKVFASQGNEAYEVKLLKEGKSPLLVRIEAVVTASGEECRIALIDITRRKRTDEVLHESDERFRALANAIPQLCWMANADGWIFWYNQRWYEYTGTTPEQMEGWGWQSVHDPEVLLQVLEQWKASISTGKQFDMVFPLRGSDGVFRPFLTRVMPEFDQDGNVFRWCGTNTDISERTQAEEALRESEHRERERAAELATVLDAVPTPVIIVHDSDSLHMTGNRAADELLRHPRGAEVSLSAPIEARPRHFRAFKDGRELRLDELPAQRAARGIFVEDFEFSIVFDDGTTRHVLGYGTPLLNDEGQTYGAVHVLVDITERKLAEEALRETRDYLENLLNYANAPIIVWDSSFRVTRFNHAFEQLTGLKNDDVIGKKLDILFPDNTRDESMILIKNALSGERWETVEIPIMHTNGSVCTVLWNSANIHDRDNTKVVATIAQGQDITKRKKAEELLRESEERLRFALETCHIGAWDLDLVDHTAYRSLEHDRIFGYAELLPQWTLDMFLQHALPEYRAEAETMVREATAAQTGWTYECRIRRADGEIRWIWFSGRYATDISGHSRVAGVVQDITERKKDEETLKKLNEELELRVVERTAELREKDQILMQQSRLAAMGEMIGNIAHQWRQPLNALGLTVQQLRITYELGEINREFLEDVINSSMEIILHMSQTIDDFRNYFKPNKDKVEFRLSESMSDTLSLVNAGFKDQFIGIELVAKDDPVVYGYRNEFAQALLNILNNARDALTERKIVDPSVTITIGSEGERAIVIISDNAGGIPEEIMAKIFDPYFTTKGPQRGTGVGLFMSKTIIEKNMGGSLTARNTGDGAEFRIEV